MLNSCISKQLPAYINEHVMSVKTEKEDGGERRGAAWGFWNATSEGLC